jgi:hypothetical protein
MKSRKAFPLRIDPELYRELEAWAQQEFRSVNGQIEFLLRDAVSRRRGRGEGESDVRSAEGKDRSTGPE